MAEETEQDDTQVQPAAPTAPPTTVSFSQEDVDRIVKDRVARAKPGDYDELKRAAAKLTEIEEANASETDKAVKAAREEVRGEIMAERVLDKIEVAAAGKFTDPTDARLHLAAKASEFIGKDGSIDTEGITRAVTSLLTDKPHLAVATTATPDPARAGIGTRATNGRVDVTPGTGRLRAAYGDSKT